MAVILRLARYGQKKRPFYRIVATEKSSRRDGRFIEVIGTYNSLSNPPEIKLAEDKVRRWVESGATASTVVRDIIKKTIPGLIEGRETHKTKKVQEARKKRKARVASKGGAAPKKTAKSKK